MIVGREVDIFPRRVSSMQAMPPADHMTSIISTCSLASRGTLRVEHNFFPSRESHDARIKKTFIVAGRKTARKS